jgi:glucose/arabinose dehydrogenase
MKTKLLIFALLSILILITYYVFSFLGNPLKRAGDIPEIKNVVSVGSSEDVNKSENNTEFPRLSVVSKNLQIPWSLVFLPSGEILFTERAGRVRIIDKDGETLADPVAIISAVKHIGEGGLLGITIDPEFSSNNFIYLYYTYSENNGDTLNRVSRFVFNGRSLENEKIIVNTIPGASNHNGGRVKFGPDKFLYITTGDAQQPSLAQNINSLAGKILRVTKEGQVVPGNPFNNPVYSYGHRNVQGIAWDDMNRLWATEHGRSGVASGFDELNLIEDGKNYGWPEIQGGETREGMVTPVVNSGAITTWAPSGAAYLDGSVYFSGLRGTGLYQYNIAAKELTKHLDGEIGRIRAVVLGSDNMLYLTTSNRDGRGVAISDDDRIIRVNPTRL